MISRPKYLALLLGVCIIGATGLMFMIRGLDSGRTAIRGSGKEGSNDAYADSLRENDSVCILVIDAFNRQPVPQASIQFTSGSDSRRIVTDAEGKGYLAPGRPGHLLVRASGYVGSRLTFEPRAGIHEFTLERVGSAEFTVMDTEERPVEGLELELRIPELVEWKLVQVPTLRSKSDAKGKLIWPELPPGDSHQWRVVSDHLLDSGPGIDSDPRKVTIEGHDIILDDDGTSALDIVGSFQVRSGERSHISLRVGASSSVYGLVVGNDGHTVSGARVKVFHRFKRVPKSGHGESFVSFTLEKSALTDAKGRFEIGGLRRGKDKKLQAYWSIPGGRYVFARRSFELLPRERKDLGRISPLGAHVVQGRVYFDPRSAIPEEVRKLHIGKKAIVIMSNSPPSPASPNDMLSETFDIPIESEFTIHGLVDGTLRFHCSSGLAGSAVNGLSFEDPPDFNGQLPGVQQVDLPIRATRINRVNVKVSVPAEARDTAFHVTCVPTQGGKAVKLSPTRGRVNTEGIVEASGHIPSGNYEIWVYPDMANSKGSAANYFGRQSASITSDVNESIEVQLGPGALVRGRAVDNRGRPWEGVVAFRVVTDGSRTENSVFTGMVNEKGEFAITGVAPNAVLQAIIFSDEIHVGPPGSETWAELAEK